VPSLCILCTANELVEFTKTDRILEKASATALIEQINSPWSLNSGKTAKILIRLSACKEVLLECICKAAEILEVRNFYLFCRKASEVAPVHIPCAPWWSQFEAAIGSIENSRLNETLYVVNTLLISASTSPHTFTAGNVIKQFSWSAVVLWNLTPTFRTR
jgi:hypothetical protein